jgi:hypothetical protein
MISIDKQFEIALKQDSTKKMFLKTLSNIFYINYFIFCVFIFNFRSYDLRIYHV